MRGFVPLAGIGDKILTGLLAHVDVIEREVSVRSTVGRALARHEPWSCRDDVSGGIKRLAGYRFCNCHRRHRPVAHDSDIDLFCDLVSDDGCGADDRACDAVVAGEGVADMTGEVGGQK